MKIGLLFAGQGAQYPGMGKSLYESSDAAGKVFDDAGEQIKEWCFEGTQETLMLTHVTQPSVYIVTMAAYQAFLEAISEFGESFWDSIELTGIAGFSLGEYSALTAAGVIDNVEKGLGIVKNRGELMLKAGSDAEGNQKGGMAAAFGDRQTILRCVDEARQGGILEGVNFNSKVQTVVAGGKEELERFKQVAAANKVKVFPLSVSTAFHSPMMEPAIEPLRQILLKSDLKVPISKIYCNVTGDDMFGGKHFAEEDITEHVSDMMAKQAGSPVYWQETIENMARDGIETFIEIGPGTILSGFVKKTLPQIKILNIEDEESLRKTMQTLFEMTEAKGE